MNTVLIIDDDQEIRESLGLLLEQNNIKTITAESSFEAEKIIKKNKIDLILLDIMMPKESGLDFCKRIAPEIEIPIIMLTALDNDFDRIISFEIGAFDYINKPFEPRLLIAKIKSILNTLTKKKHEYQKIHFDNWTLDLISYALINSHANIEHRLSYVETLTLKLLLDENHQLLSRDYIIQKIYSRGYNPEDRTVDLIISRLRKKLEPENVIQTIYGRGYICQAKQVEYI